MSLSTNARVLRRLRTTCERAKQTLSPAAQTSIEIKGIDFYTSITPFQSTIEPVEKELKDSKMGKSDVNEIVLVGGSIRISHIPKLISDSLNGKEPNKSINPDKAVAFGAAVQAAILNDDTSEKTHGLLDVTPLCQYQDCRWADDRP